MTYVTSVALLRLSAAQQRKIVIGVNPEEEKVGVGVGVVG